PAVIFGLIGGRLYHVITDWQIYFNNPLKEPIQALYIWEGGLGIWGAVALGALGVWWACRRRGLSLSAVADTVAPGIAFAQAIGRWGNWFNQELYGSPTMLPWGLEIDPAHGGEPGVLYHPTFLYESLWNVALGFALIYLGRRFSLRHGRLFALYVAGYTLGRFWIEGLRIDPVGGIDHAVEFLGLRINQYTALALFVGALVYFWVTRNKTSEEVVVVHSDDDADPAHGADQADQPDPADLSDKADQTDEGGKSDQTDRAGQADQTGEPGENASVSETEPASEQAERASGQDAEPVPEEKNSR